MKSNSNKCSPMSSAASEAPVSGTRESSTPARAGSARRTKTKRNSQGNLMRNSPARRSHAGATPRLAQRAAMPFRGHQLPVRCSTRRNFMMSSSHMCTASAKPMKRKRPKPGGRLTKREVREDEHDGDVGAVASSSSGRDTRSPCAVQMGPRQAEHTRATRPQRRPGGAKLGAKADAHPGQARAPREAAARARTKAK
eukprot:15466760-Alexandrium_andersonii.AAC.1